jgi:L-lactate dehydrogenase complex protein LldG
MIMSSREEILKRIKDNKPQPTPVPANYHYVTAAEDTETLFSDVLKAIGGEAVKVNSWEEIVSYLDEHFPGVTNRATPIPALANWADFSLNVEDPHELETINLTVIEADFGVAESGAVWVSEKHLPHRVLPFITQYLAVVIPAASLVNNMHDAFNIVNISEQGWGAFIAGPSKTADIEQSLVIGAHGARGLTVFLLA